MFYGQPEGTAWETIDDRFEACYVGHAGQSAYGHGARWSKGPV